MTRCPSCGGAKSKRAELCKVCRRAANAAGARLLIAAPDAAPPSRRPRSVGQNGAFHGKCSTIARLAVGDTADRAVLERAAYEAKRHLLDRASEEFGRPIESSTQLTAEEMSEVLDWQTEEIVAMQLPEPTTP